MGLLHSTRSCSSSQIQEDETRKVYISELALDASYADRRHDLEYIRSAIVDRLKALRIPLTTNPQEAAFMIIIFTRCSLPQCSQVLLNLLRRPEVLHCVFLCDWTRLPPTASTNMRTLLNDYVEGKRPAANTCSDDDLLKSCGELQLDDHDQLVLALSHMWTESITRACWLPDHVYIPDISSIPGYIVEKFADIVADVVEPIIEDVVEPIIEDDVKIIGDDLKELKVCSAEHMGGSLLAMKHQNENETRKAKMTLEEDFNAMSLRMAILERKRFEIGMGIGKGKGRNKGKGKSKGKCEGNSKGKLNV